MAQVAGNAIRDVRDVGGQAQQAGAKALSEAQEVAHDATARGTLLASSLKDKAASVAETQKGNLADQR